MGKSPFEKILLGLATLVQFPQQFFTTLLFSILGLPKLFFPQFEDVSLKFLELLILTLVRLDFGEGNSGVLPIISHSFSRTFGFRGTLMSPVLQGITFDLRSSFCDGILWIS